MEFTKQFEDMRPYRDHEVQPAIERLVSHPGFGDVMNYLYEGQNITEITRKFREVRTVDQFQLLFSHYTVKWIVDNTSDGLTDEVAPGLDPARPYLFVANHRDIVLDAAIMQYLLHQHGHRTSQITFGENLMSGQLVLDLGKLNKMFTFFRGGNRVEQYRKALLNSAYINHVINFQKESIWIAQRNGRTKDGNDKTQTGLIKMCAMNSPEVLKTLENLNIVPVTISYEIEPCAIQKVRELYLSKRQKYVKEPDEDLRSILAGITGRKGRIHYVFGNPLNNFLQELSEMNLHDNEIIERVTQEIDRQVYADYRLWPSNYIAFDFLSGSDEYAGSYGEEDLERFNSTMEQLTGSLEGFDREELKQMYLAMYANPVRNKRRSKHLARDGSDG
jgi:hypothetical protein